ncbi:hypothetical protein DS745_14715 [Anaerobacillus alkaliphilus]|uniref:Uncharacterized protein n=1 Tax=Anaerobacillus alkaliphilus TaxID=1548597 RepID=A0A4Q0VSD4_9BACI|nr:hypothetical protein [Anaerobacillus alkaliphilus]RXI99471.1 hypothetical protein DS745_14715 [Anaerobacillus alkaliphilus]
MDKYTGVELVNETKEIIAEYPEVKDYLTKHPLDYYQYGIVVKTNEEKHELINLLQTLDLFETSFAIYMLENATTKSTFLDFGFISNEKKYFLYGDLVIPFTTSGNNEKDVLAALEQMDEHLVGVDTCTNKTYYFVERYHQELIQGVADAYKIIVTFYP